MNTQQHFLTMAENSPEYYNPAGQYRESLNTWLSYADEKHLFTDKGNDSSNEYYAGQLMMQFEEFHEKMATGDRSPDGAMSEGLISIGKRRPEDWWPVGDTPEEFK